MTYRLLPHTADLKIEVFDKTLKSAFKESALALIKTMSEGIEIMPKKSISIKAKGNNKEDLFVSFLGEFLFLFDAKRFIASDIKSLKIKDNKLEAVVLGDSADKYDFSNKVKAITYNQLSVSKNKAGYKIVFVVDV